MPFQRKLLLIVVLVLIVVLLWPKGQDDLTPSSQDRHQEVEEVEEEIVMQPTPDTRVDASESTSDTAVSEEDPALDDLAEVPLSDDLEASTTDAEGTDDASAPSSPLRLSQEERQYLEQRGLDNPEEQVLSDLMGRNELLPQDSLVGGDMAFVEQQSQLLNHRWVLATFTDGQSQGQALYEFEIGPGGDLIWVLLAYETP